MILSYNVLVKAAVTQLLSHKMCFHTDGYGIVRIQNHDLPIIFYCITQKPNTLVVFCR